MPNQNQSSSDGRRRSRLVGSFGQISRWPLWLIVVAMLGVAFAVFVVADDELRDTLAFISGQNNGLAFRGITLTLTVSAASFGLSILVGAIFGLMRASKNLVLYNIASAYVELIRAVPLVVFLLYVAFVLTPLLVSGINALGNLVGIDEILTTRDIPLLLRAIFAIALLYSAFIAEIFRAGIQSIEKGQIEAGRALGMNYRIIMVAVVLPQAVRRIVPPIANEFVAMVKDSSLVTVLGIQDITQLTRLYYSANFQFLQSLSVLAFVYVVIILILTRVATWIERKLATPDK